MAALTIPDLQLKGWKPGSIDEERRRAEDFAMTIYMWAERGGPTVEQVSYFVDLPRTFVTILKRALLEEYLAKVNVRELVLL
jgi:hypothetical protein